MKETLHHVEMSVIGAILCDPARTMPLCEQRITVDHFTMPEARTVWPLLLKQWQRQGICDGVLLATEIGKNAVFGWLQQCLNKMPTSYHAAQYVEQLCQGFLQRQLLQWAGQAMVAAQTLPPQEAMTQVERSLVTLREAEKVTYGGFKTSGDYAPEILADYTLLHQKRFLEHDRNFFLGLTLPWSVLNVSYLGLKPGIHVIGARPSQGKTAVAVCMSLGMAKKGIKQLFFSIDMPRRSLVERYAVLGSQVSLPRLNFGASKAEVETLGEGLKAIPEEILISDTAYIDRMIGEIYRAVKYDGVKCVWIDYLQILSGESERRYGNKKEMLDSILAQLKRCALDLEIPIFCLCQLNRETGKDARKEPSLADIGDTGNVEREASTVLLLWKDPDVRAAWDVTPPYRLAKDELAVAKAIEPMWLILAKNQQGPTARRPFLFYKNWFMYRPADHEAKPLVERNEEGKVRRVDYEPLFSTVRDDFIKLHKPDGTGLDDALHRFRALGPRGI